MSVKPDDLSIYLQELTVTRDADRIELDDHLRLLHLREHNKIRRQTNLKTR